MNCVPGGLADGEEEGLESGKVSDQLEDAEDLGDAHQPHHLARLPDDVELAQVVHDEVDKVGQDGEQVHQVHLRDHGRYDVMYTQNFIGGTPRKSWYCPTVNLRLK